MAASKILVRKIELQLTEKEFIKLGKLAQAKGLTLSGLLREALDLPQAAKRGRPRKK